jgi:hypothetical protein
MNLVVMPQRWAAVSNGLRMFVLLCTHFLTKQQQEHGEGDSRHSSSLAEGLSASSLAARVTTALDTVEKTLASITEQLVACAPPQQQQQISSPVIPIPPASAEVSALRQQQQQLVDSKGAPTVAKTAAVGGLDREQADAPNSTAGYRRKMIVLAKLMSVPRTRRMESVSALVDEAIQTDNLSSMFHGWCPWI